MEEEYRDFDFSDIFTRSSLSRREFLKRVGGGIIIWFFIY